MRTIASWFCLSALISAPTALFAQTRVDSVRSDARVVASVDTSARRLALSQLLADAHLRNRLPADLVSYKASVETEVAIVLRRQEGTEAVVALEQIASTAHWTRAGKFEQRVVGYRAQQTGVTISMLSLFESGWLNPSLYGNRLRLRAASSGPDSSPPQTRGRTRGGARRDVTADTVPIVHPLAIDRDAFYEFSGGDTLVTIQTGARRIPIVRVHVQGKTGLKSPVALFDGDIDLDASRGTLVRLRGYFVRIGTARPRGLMFRLADAIAFVEYENSERDGKYWLPTMQRVELQVSAPMFGDQRAIVRIVSRFPEMAINDTTLDSVTLARADSLRIFGRRRLVFAPSDSLASFKTWRYSIGAITSGLHSNDFNDVAPDRLRPDGKPRMTLAAPHAADVLHYNRVEGLFTGLGLKYALRNAAPGVVLRANAGWAWGEQTARGRVSAERTRGSWITALRAGRSLDLTNDFRSTLDSGNSILSALFGSPDPYDYVDRWSATASVTRMLGRRNALFRAEFGSADDRYALASQTHTLWGNRKYPANRGVDEGSYARTAVMLEWHPDVGAEFVQPGSTMRVSYERGDGNLAFQRAEVRATTRRTFGPFLAAARGDAGILLSDRPPSQQLFELGSSQALPGYANKEFAGTQSVVLRGQLRYTSPFFRQPIRWGRSVFLPAFAPGLMVGAQSGWTDAPKLRDVESIARLGMLADTLGVLHPISRVTGNPRTTASAGIHIFSGGLFIGAARAVDHSAKWRLLISGGQLF